MDIDDRRALATRKKVKRAASLVREASRELAQAFDCDVVAAAHVRDERDLERAAQMLQVAFARQPGPIDIIVTAPIGAPSNHTPKAPQGAKEATSS